MIKGGLWITLEKKQINQGIGKLIKQTREKFGYKVSDLCLGYCQEKKYRRIESNECVSRYEEFDFFIHRMGLDPENFEVLLSGEEYEKLLSRNSLEAAVSEKDYVRANELLEEYCLEYEKNGLLEEQYIYKIRAIIEKQKQNYQLALQYIEKAVFTTVKGSGLDNIENKYLGLHELELFLLWAEITNDTGDKEKAINIAEKVLVYADQVIKQDSVRIKIYPKVLVLLYQLKEEISLAELQLYEEQLELFRKEKVWFFSVEIMEILQEMYEKLNLKGKQKHIRSFCENLKAICQEFRVEPYCSKQAFGWFMESGQRYYSLCSELLYGERKARKISQEDLSDGIYENPESLARVESGKIMPTNKNLKKLLERFGINNDRQYTSLIVEDYEVLQKKNSYEQLILRGDYESARVAFFEIKDMLDNEEPYNQQYILGQETRIAHALNEIDDEEAEKRIREAFYITSERAVEEIGRNPTQQEFQLINQVGKFLARQNKIEESIAIFAPLIEMYEKSPLKGICRNFSRISMVLNYAILCEAKGEIFCAEEIVSDAIPRGLKSGSISYLDNGLTELACIKGHNKEENIESIKRYYIEANNVSVFLYKDSYAKRVKRGYETEVGEPFPETDK